MGGVFMSKKQIQVGLLGLGTVGSGVARILQENAKSIQLKVSVPIKLTKVLVRDLQRSRAAEIPAEVLTTKAEEIIDNPEIDIVIEVMGGIEPARTYILEAIANGKSIVTANKELMAKHGKEILEAAQKYEVAVQFEASVGGGIPIIRPMKRCLAANDIEEIMGIINGTTNYILTKMTDEGVDFQEVLAEAQKAGYAEADPTADVAGYDAAYKIAILSSIGFSSRVGFDDVYFEGIEKISSKDIEYAKDLGCTIKLLAIAKELEDGIEVRVHPTMIPNTHPLASVKDVFNAIFVKGDAVGEVMFYGRGAGQMPTGSAVVADVIDISRDIIHNVHSSLNCTCFVDKKLKKIEDVNSSYYVRLECLNEPGVLSQIAGVFGKNNVGLCSVIQKGQKVDKNLAEIVWVTYEVKEKDLQDALKELTSLSIIKQINNVIRVEGGIQ